MFLGDFVYLRRISGAWWTLLKSVSCSFANSHVNMQLWQLSQFETFFSIFFLLFPGSLLEYRSLLPVSLCRYEKVYLLSFSKRCYPPKYLGDDLFFPSPTMTTEPWSLIFNYVTYFCQLSAQFIVCHMLISSNIFNNFDHFCLPFNLLSNCFNSVQAFDVFKILCIGYDIETW